MACSSGLWRRCSRRCCRKGKKDKDSRQRKQPQSGEISSLVRIAPREKSRALHLSVREEREQWVSEGERVGGIERLEQRLQAFSDDTVASS